MLFLRPVTLVADVTWSTVVVVVVVVAVVVFSSSASAGRTSTLLTSARVMRIVIIFFIFPDPPFMVYFGFLGSVTSASLLMTVSL